MATNEYEQVINLLRKESGGDALSSYELSFLKERSTRVCEAPASSLQYVSFDQQDPRLIDAQRPR